MNNQLSFLFNRLKLCCCHLGRSTTTNLLIKIVSTTWKHKVLWRVAGATSERERKRERERERERDNSGNMKPSTHTHRADITGIHGVSSSLWLPINQSKSAKRVASEGTSDVTYNKKEQKNNNKSFLTNLLKTINWFSYVHVWIMEISNKLKLTVGTISWYTSWQST